MTELEYRHRHNMLWRDIVDYLHEVKRGEAKIYYKSITDLKSALLNAQKENSGRIFNAVYYDCFACDFAFEENGTSEDMCVKCPLLDKLGCICYDACTGSYVLLKEAYARQDYEKAIRIAIRIRDAWREVK